MNFIRISFIFLCTFAGDCFTYFTQMKKNCFRALYAAICFGLALAVAACSGNKDAAAEKAEASELGAADDVILLSGNLMDVLTNAQFTVTDNGIDVSPAFQKLFDNGASPSEKKRVEKLLKIRGVDFSHCFFKATSQNECVLAFGLTDPEAFDQWMSQDMDYPKAAEQDGFTIYEPDNNLKVFVKSKDAYMAINENGECTLEFLNALKEKAKANPLMDWQKEAISKSATCVALVKADRFFNENGISTPYGDFDTETLKGGYAEITASLKGLKLDITGKLRNAQGEVLSTKGKLENINLNVLKYINKDDNIAFAAKLPSDVNWKEVLEAINKQTDGALYGNGNTAIINKVEEVLGNIDGTVMVSAHPKSLLLAFNGPQYWDATVAGQMKKGAASSYIKEITTLASRYGIHATTESGATVIKLSTYTFYMKDIDGMFILSTLPISDKGGSILKQEYFKDNIAALEATVAKGTQLSGSIDLPFQPIVAITSDGESASFAVEIVSDDEKYLLDALFKFIASIN